VTKGGCHCGAVRIEVRGAPTRVIVCNCSMCTRKGYLHWIVPVEDVVVHGGEHLTTYTFNTHVARHHFCKVCGCAPYYVPRSDPDKLDVNLRCLEGAALERLPVETFDGEHWEAQYERYARTRDGA
jgi:hypothetical protein